MLHTQQGAFAGERKPAGAHNRKEEVMSLVTVDTVYVKVRELIKLSFST